jgi:hypothetical protein
MKLDDYLTVEDVAACLKMSTSWVYKHKSRLGGVKLGDRVLRFPAATTTPAQAAEIPLDDL